MWLQQTYNLFFGNNKKAFFSLLICCIVFAIFNSPLTHFPHYDVEVYRYVGMCITKGFAPYKDAFDHKPPLIYFFSALCYPFGIWANWLLGVFMCTLASFYLWKLGVYYKVKQALFLPIVCILFLFWQVEFTGRYADTRFFTTIFLIIIFYLVMVKPNSHFYIKGILAALVFFTQQNEILIAALLLAYNFKQLFDADLNKALKAFGIISVYFFGFAVLLLSFFAFHNAVYLFYYGVFKFNTLYFLKPIGLKLHLFRLNYMFHNSFIPKIFLISFIGFIVAFFTKGKKVIHQDFYIFTFLISITAVYNITLSGYYWMYYTFHLLLPSIMLLFTIQLSLGHFKMNKVFAPGILVILVLTIGARRAIVFNAYNNFMPYKFNVAYKMRYKTFQEHIDSVKGLPNSVFIFNDASTLSLVNNNGIKTNTKWMLNYFWDESINKHIKFDTSAIIFNTELLAPIRTNKPNYIVSSKKNPDEQYILRPDIATFWYGFLDSNYIAIKTAEWDTSLVLYKLK